MRYLIIILLSLCCFEVSSKTTRRTHVVTDLTYEVVEGLKSLPITLRSNNYKYSLINNNGRSSLVYNDGDSLHFISFKSVQNLDNIIEKNSQTSQLPTSMSYCYLPRRRFDMLFATVNSGRFTHSHSIDNGKSWIDPIVNEIYTKSSVQFCSRKNLTDIEAYMWGCGNLTSSNGNDRSILFSVTSSNGGNSWHSPKIVLKHNLYSLDEGAISIYHKRSKKPYIQKKRDVVYIVAIDSLTGRAFVSTSLDNFKFSYPKRYPSLDDTYHHNLSIYKNKGVVLYLRKSDITERYELWAHTANIDKMARDRIKNRRHYKLFVFEKDESIDDFCFDGALCSRNRFVLSISRRWEDGVTAIKYVNVKLNNYN